MKIRSGEICLALFCAISSVSWGAGAADCEIVLPERPTVSEEFAAKELKYHIEGATGVSVPVVSEGRTKGASRRFFVGNTKALSGAGIEYRKLRVEERVVKGVGADVYLAGGEMPGFDDLVRTEEYRNSFAVAGGGTLYAVYDFLEKDMGVRWIWPGELGEVIPRKEVPCMDGVERTGIEPLLERELRGNIERSRRITKANRLWGWKSRENAKAEVERRRLWLTRNRMGYRRRFRFGHAFVDWHERFRERPEYFALQPGGRRGCFSNLKPGDGDNKYYPLCVSNPEVHDQIVKTWLKELRDAAEATPYINCCENDSPGFCVCPACRSWDATDPLFEKHPYWNGSIRELSTRNRFVMADSQWSEEGECVKCVPPSVSDRYVKFYNAVLEKVRRVCPNAEVCAYAYSNYSQPPRETRVDDGVVISLVPEIIFPYSQKESDRFRTVWKGWNRMGARQILYRPNYLYGGGSMPYSQARRMAADINFAYEHGMIAADISSLHGAWSAQAMKNYVAARILREPDAGYEKMSGEFYSAFGRAADDVRRYCELLECLDDRFTTEKWAEIGKSNLSRKGAPGGSWCNFVLNIADLYTEEWFAEADSILQNAADKTRGAERERVLFLRKGLKDGLLTYRVRVAQKKGDVEAFRAAFENMVKYRASVEADNVCGWAWFADAEDRQAGWPHKTQKYR